MFKCGEAKVNDDTAYFINITSVTFCSALKIQIKFKRLLNIQIFLYNKSWHKHIL